MFEKVGSIVNYFWVQWNWPKNMHMHFNPCVFPVALSTEAARMSTWRRISSWLIHRVHAPRHSLTCERWAHGCVCPQGNTSSSPPPLRLVRRRTLSSESSLRSNRKQSKSLLHHFKSSLCIWNVNILLIFFYCRELDDEISADFGEEVRKTETWIK